MKRFLILAIVIPVLTSIAVFAQQNPIKKGEQLNKLNFLIGKWEAAGTRITPNGEVKTSGTVIYEWTVGGVWLQELTIAQTPQIDGTIHNLRLLTFDEKSGEYVGTVLDNLNSRTYPVRMKWLDNKTLESVIEVEGQNQKWKKFKIINVLTKVSDSEVRVVQQQSVDDETPKPTGNRVMKKISRE